MSHVKNVVKKPWGYEYLAYENEEVAVWFLHLNHGESTSMHCHPSKTTGLVCLDGEVIVSFLSNKFPLDPRHKLMIRKGLFHSTKAVSAGGAFVLEIETPVDKDDLVRFQDSYGRQGKPYEDSSFEFPKTEDCIWIEDPESTKEDNIYVIGNTKMTVKKIDDISYFETLDDNTNLVFLKGGVITEYGIYVSGAGGVASSKVLKSLIKVFGRLKEDTVVMIMEECDE